MDESVRNFLEADPELLNKHLFLKDENDSFGPSAIAPYRSVLPKPGLCLKTKTDKGEKVFINICKGDNLPAPKDITDEELLQLLDSDDPTGFRIPMSLGEAHAELDKGGKGCVAYDVVINPTFFENVRNREVLMGFVITVVLEGLEAKYNMSLNRDWRILKNRKFVGTLAEQNVRAQSKPWIMEMDSSHSQQTKAPGRPSITELKSAETKKSLGVEPPYTIIQEPSQNYPEFLVADIHLPNVKMAASLTLDIGEDRLVLTTRSNVYHLDIYLPYYLLPNESVAQFNRKTKILSVTMPVKPIVK